MEAEAGKKISDRVTLVEPLASGSMGVVWIAEHETLQTRVAVKLLHKRFKEAQPSASRRFALEASAAARISSPHVVRMFDHGVTEDGTLFIVMELLKGENLADRMERVGALPIEETVTIATQSAKALSAAHALELVHRDIKPANIFLTDEHGELFVKVLDFGVVKQLAGKPDAPKLSEPGMLLGTPAYMCRDLIVSSGGQAGPQVDLWSFSVVLYRCLTGILPFAGDTASDVLKSIVAVEYKPPSELRRELGPKVDAWFARAFHKDPKERFASAADLASTFRALFAARPPKRQPLPLFVGAGLVLAGAVAIGSLWTSTPPTSRSLGTRGSATAASTTIASTPVPPPSTAPPTAEPVDPAVLAALAARAKKHEVAVTAGVVWLECTSGDCPQPTRSIRLPAFFIDRTEVTVMDYATCTEKGDCNKRRIQGPTVEEPNVPKSGKCNWHGVGRESYPMNCVSYAQAESYCRWAGGRLPTEAEWVRAARGAERQQFPWGDELASCERTVMADADGEGCGRGTSWKAGGMPEDRSRFEVRDLAGNMREWVADWFDDAAVESTKRRRAVKGGSYIDRDAKALSIRTRNALVPTERSYLVGFRCMRLAE